MIVESSESIPNDKQLEHTIYSKLNVFCRNIGREFFVKQTIHTLVEKYKSLPQIMEDVGYKTPFSEDDYSSRAKVFLNFQNNITDEGWPVNQEGVKIVLGQYEQALKIAISVAQQIAPGESQIVSMGGSFADGTANPGVFPIGYTFENAHFSHLLNAPSKRSLREDSMEISNYHISDIDVMFKLSTIQSGHKVHERFDEISKMVFDEYGILIHFLDSRAVEHSKHTLGERESVSINDLQNAGGLGNYFTERKNRNFMNG